mgnify:CR=1 FL=1
MNKIKTGTLYGVGVGPGDPELLTLKAHRLIQAAAVIAYPAAEGVPSFARQIVASYLNEDQREILMEMPMVAARFPAQDVYDKGAKEISEALEAGLDVVVLCEGDPFFYGSFMYLFARLEDRYKTEIVPGVSSLMTCAAVARMPLVARNDRFTVLTGPMSDDEILAGLADSQAIAIMKVGRHLPRLVGLVKQAGLLDVAVYVERASLENQRVMPLADLAEATAPYFSMILIHRRGMAWSPSDVKKVTG